MGDKKPLNIIRFNDNNKIGNMLNFGANISNGEYLFKIDDDDYYSPLWIENTVNLHKKTNNKYLLAIRRGHKAHHKKLSKHEGECFGMLLVPFKYFRQFK